MLEYSSITIKAIRAKKKPKKEDNFQLSSFIISSAGLEISKIIDFSGFIYNTPIKRG